MLKRLLYLTRKFVKILLYGISPANLSYGSNVTMGNNVSIGENVVLYPTAPIHIGDNTMIALNVVIHTSTHDYNNHPMWKHRVDRPVKIGSHVWIGTGAIILPGVKIGDYSVVGAGSVVTAHVPPFAIVAGNPARIIKYRNKNIIEQFDEGIVYPGIVKIETFLEDCKICKQINF